MVTNVHERLIWAPVSRVRVLIDQLASADDQFWPAGRWPPIRFDRPLAEGAVGGHGPIRYFVEAYEPGRSITFRFTGPRGFHGTHGLVVEDLEDSGVRLRHELKMRTSGWARLSWPLVFRWLHDALIEDAFDRAEAAGERKPVRQRTLTPYVRLLRVVLTWRMRRMRSYKPAAMSLTGR